MDIQYRTLKSEEITRELFDKFIRRQEVTKCRRKIDGIWYVCNINFIDDWNEEDYKTLIRCLKNTINTNGSVFGAFIHSELKGFTSVEPNLFGKNKEYLDLSCIHVSHDMRGRRIGKHLFNLAAQRAKDCGAKKLYISSHSAVETQAFYSALGCTETSECNKPHAEQKPFDCQLEYVL